MRDNSTTTPTSDASLDSEGAILAWLEQQVRASATGVSFDYVPFGFRFMRHHHIGEPCKSIAEAIRQDGGPASSSPSPAIVKGAGEVDFPRVLHSTVLSTLAQYRDDLMRPPSTDSRDRRLDHIKTLIAALSASNAAQVSK